MDKGKKVVLHDGGVTLYNSDCMEIMRGMADNSFDLAVVDPPYGIGSDNMNMGSAPNRSEPGKYPGVSAAVKIRKKNRLNQGAGKLKGRRLNMSDTSWDVAPPREYFTELFRVSRNQIIWGANYFDLPPTRGMVCWDKLQPWENFSQFELAWTSFSVPAAMFRYSNTGGNNRDKKVHPTQKPVALYEWLLMKYADKGCSVLDTHAGSLSLAIAAHRLGHRFTGIEINKSYFDDSIARLKIETSQLRIK